MSVCIYAMRGRAPDYTSFSLGAFGATAVCVTVICSLRGGVWESTTDASATHQPSVSSEIEPLYYKAVSGQFDCEAPIKFPPTKLPQ